jgi:hypothetical protein
MKEYFNNYAENYFTIILTTIFFCFSIYLFKTPINLEYISPYIFLVVFFAIITFLSNIQEINKILLTILYFLILILISSFGSKIFNAEEHSKILNIETKDFKYRNKNIEMKNTRILTKEMAFQYANKIIGQEYNGVIISSQYEVDVEKGFIQVTNGKMEWVFPLDFSSFTRWLKQDNVPGYVIVSATNPEEKPRLILDKKMKYTSNAFFYNNIERIMWLQSLFSDVETHMELDDNGKPFYIGIVVKPAIGFYGKIAKEVIIINPENKDIEHLTIEETIKKHSWIDRLQPEPVVLEQVKSYGTFQDGLLNYMFFGENIKKPAIEEAWFVLDNNHTYWFLEMTSENSKDSSLIEALFVDTQTGKTIKKTLSGITNGNGAIQAVEASLGADATKWDATLAIPRYINNEFYWIVTIKSSANNLFQKIAAIKGNDLSHIILANSLEELEKKLSNNHLNIIDIKDNNSTTNNNNKLINKEEIIKQMLIKIEELNVLKKELEME